MSATVATNVAVRAASYAHVQQLLFDLPLAVLPARVDQILAAVGPRLLGFASDQGTVQLSADLLAEPLPAAADVAVTPDGVAIVPIRGTFTRRAGAMASLSGLVSYEQMTGLVEAVAARPDVKGLVLAIDSPGGAVNGVVEAASALRAVKQTKPVYAVADGMAASAAYWLAAQADQLFVSPSAIVGSIGVFAVRVDATKADQQAGVSYTLVKSGALKGAGDPHTAPTAAEFADLQRQVDQAAQMFFGAVAQARGITADAVAGLEGATFMVGDAIAANLADAEGTVADAVAAMTQRLTRSPAMPSGMPLPGMPPKKRPTGPIMPGAHAPKEETMAEDGTGAAGQGAQVIDITSDPRVKAHVDAEAKRLAAEQIERDREIRGLCALFGCADKAQDFIAAGKTRAEVYEALQAAKVAAEAEAETRGSFAGAGPSTAKTAQLRPDAYDTHWNEAMAAAQSARPAALVG